MLLDIPEIKIVIRHGGQSRCMHAFDVLNNRRSSGPMNDLEQKPRKLRHTEVCSFLPQLYDQQVIDVKYSSIVRKTYVFHESTRVSPSPSILLTHCSRKTTLRFVHVVLSKQSFDLPTDQGERASIERPFSAGHLQDTVGLGNGK